MARRRKKKQQPETPMERLKAQPLWFWGATLIFAGIFSNVFNGFMIEAQNLRGAAARGANFGAGIAALFFILIGTVLIIMHFTRKK